MVSLLQGVEHTNLLASPSRILAVSTDAAHSMTTDSGLSLPTMIGIVDSLRHLPPGSVQFIELPTVAYAANPNWVSWPASDAALFNAIARDEAVHPTAKVSGRAVADRLVQLTAARSAARSANASAPSTNGPRNLARSYGGITGSANVCDDGTAFAGPRGGS